MPLSPTLPPPPKGIVLDDDGQIPAPPKGVTLDSDSTPVTMNQRRPSWSGTTPSFTSKPNPKLVSAEAGTGALTGGLVEAAATGKGGGEAVPQAAMPALDVANRYAVQPFNKMAAKGAEVGGKVAETLTANPGTIASHALPIPPQPLVSTEQFEQEHPTMAGVSKGAGEMLGGVAADPRNWPFFASSAARPLLQKLISGGFSAQIGLQTAEGAKKLYDNWDTLTPQQRAEIGTSTGVGALLLAHGAAKTGGAYEALPGEGVPRAESLFRNLIYNHSGAELPPDPTFEQANSAYRAAASNLHPDVNANHIDEMKNLNESWQALQKAGRFAPTPPPPEPRQPGEPPLALPGQPEPMHAISAEEIKEVGDNLAKLPTEERPQATLAAHTALSTELLNQGKLVVDGKVEIIRNQKQAETLAQRLINEEIGRQDQESKKAANEAVPAPPAGITLDETPKTAQTGSSSAEEAPTFKKGDRVTLPKGETGTIVNFYGKGTARVQMDGGGRVPIDTAKLRPVQAASESKVPEVTQPENVIPSQLESPPAGLLGQRTEPGGFLTGGVKSDHDTSRESEPTTTLDAAKHSGTVSQGLEPGPSQTRATEETAARIPAGPKSEGKGVESADDTSGANKPEQPGRREGGSGLQPAGETIPQRDVQGTTTLSGTGNGPTRTGVGSGNETVTAAANSGPDIPVRSTTEGGSGKTDGSSAAPVPKTDWQTLFDKASEAQPDKVEELRKMSGEQLRGVLASKGPDFIAGAAPTRIEDVPEQHWRDAIERDRKQSEKVGGRPNPRAAVLGAMRDLGFEPKDAFDRAQAIAGRLQPSSDIRGPSETSKPERRESWRTPRVAEDIGKWQPPPELGAFSAPDHGASARTETERRMGGPLTRSSSEVAPGKVGEMKISDLKVAPAKFQYKLGTDAAGTSTLLKETKVFNPDLAGVISVWRDPADGKTYVVNGHHRYELAKRLNEKAVTVRHIVAKDATTARAIGALQNIAEGRGTAVDAAKFFRDSGLTPEQLKEKGISLGEKTASDGMAMSRLDPSIFQKVVSGDLRQGRAIAIGEATEDPAEQKAILSLVERKERGGAKVSDDTLSELIRLVKGSQQTTETTADLFGSQEITRSLALEKAEISAFIKQQLAKDKKLFGFVSKGDRATELERGGNKIDVQKSKDISTGAAQAEEVYNLLSARGGPIASILDETAKQLADGDNAQSVKSEAYSRIRAEVSKTLGGSTGGSAAGPEGTSENPPDLGPTLFSPETELAPPFYSKAERIVEQKAPGFASGQSILATLRNAGVKEDEIKWLGLDDFLKDKPKASKKDVLDFIRENQVQVKEVAKNAPKYRQPPTWDSVGGLVEHPSATKYEQYTLPGEKRNYTELLMTLPEATPPTKHFAVQQSSNGHDWHVVNTYGGIVVTGGTREYAEQRAQEMNAQGLPAHLRGRDRSPDTFTSGHFDEPNILAHVRFDERTDADGNKILFVEEVQSDWHQKGKKVGYAGPPQFTPEEQELRMLNGRTWGEGGPWTEAEQARARELQAKVGVSIQEKINRANRGVPNAPFKSDWHELAMKTMLRKAAEGGYDKIGWVTGEQTAERYDLSKSIQMIGYRKTTGPGIPETYMLTARTSDGRFIDLGAKTESELADTVGKDIAQKIVSGEGDGSDGDKVLSGLDLKTGGEWAKNLYDRAIPNFLSKYGKKWGARVGNDKITAANVRNLRVQERTTSTIEGQVRNYAVYDGDGKEHGAFKTIQEAKAKIDALREGESVHSLTITPEMRKSVLSEGQPLFSPASEPIEPSKAKDISFQVKQTEPGLPSYIRLNPEALEAINRALGVRINGVNLQAEIIPGLVTNLKAQADTMTGAPAEHLRKLANAMQENVDKESGLSIIRQGATEAHELATLHEEMLHSMQRKAGKGNLFAGLPGGEILKEPGIAKIANDRIIPGLKRAGLATPDAIVVAEAMVDLLRGDADQDLTPEEIEVSSQKYFEAAAQKSGIESLRRYQAVQDYIAKRHGELGVDYGKHTEAAREAGQRGLTRVLSKLAGEPTGSAGEGISGKPEPDKGGLHSLARRGAEGVAPSANTGEAGPRNARPSKGPATTLASTSPIGLSDEELEDWSKSKGFRVEPAGEQLDIFGGNEPVMRVFRSGARGREQRGLVYQGQLDKLSQPKPEPKEPFQLTGGEARDDQPKLFGAGDLGEIIGSGKDSGIKLPAKQARESSLFSGESGELNVSELGKTVAGATGAVGNYLREVSHYTDLARGLQHDLQTLDTQKQADILRGVQTMQGLKKEGLTHADDEAIYHHLENPEAQPLKGKQDDWLDQQVLPIAEQNEELYTELSKGGGVPIENYVHRVVKGKGGMLDRIAQNAKSVGTKATLSKSAPQTKHRTYMALENQSAQGNLGKDTPQKGDRVVVSIKGGQVTAWRNGEPENLGGISHTEDGKVFEDKDGNVWKLTQATTKEIEAHTGTEYYHSAFASLIASNIQLNSAVRAMRFLEAYKASPEFKEIAWKDTGEPPKGWQPTKLQQFNGYYFEPRTAEVLDEYADRMRQGQFGVLQTVQKFLRAAYLINPIVHPLNVAASWSLEKGLTGFAPWKWKTIYQTGNKAVKAVLEQNQDLLDALDAGAALQSHRESLQDIHKLFFERLAEGLDKKEPWAVKVAQSLGIEHGNLLNLLHKPSSIAAWTSSDIMYLQAAYQYQAEHSGVSLADAFKEVGRIIPEYRVPTRIADSRVASKAMTNPLISWFGAYHYGLLKGFAETAKSALGAAEPAPGRTKAEEVGKGWDRLALLGLITMVLFPYVFDKEAKKVTGNEHARMRRPGPFGYVDSVEQVLEGKQDVSTAVQKVVTPSPITKGVAEVGFNREFYSGHQIYDPHADWRTQTEQIGHYLLGNVGPGGQYKEHAETTEQKQKFWWQQAGVQMGKTRAEKVAADIAMSKVGTEAESPEDHANRVGRREALDELRKGNRKPLESAEAKHEITSKQGKAIERRAKLEPLEDTVHNFTIEETKKVLDAARADKNEKEIKLLEHVLSQKRLRARSYGWQSQAVSQ